MKEVHLYQRLFLNTDWQKKLQLPFYGLSLEKENRRVSTTRMYSTA